MVFPIALGASIMPLLTIIDATMIIWRLRQIGFGAQAGVMYTFITFLFCTSHQFSAGCFHCVTS